MKRRMLLFTAPYQIAIQEEPLPAPAANQVLVQTLVSAISPGTELLIYRGQAPTDMAIDETITSLSGGLQFPLQYGYAVVGRVTARGSAVSPDWQGKLVFAFHPHESHFLTTPETLEVIPSELLPEEAVFLPNMETAVNLLLDGQPLLGERVVVFGQGIVGLLTTALLARFPLAQLVTVDRYPLRRQASLDLGAQVSLDPGDPDFLNRLTSLLNDPRRYPGADLSYELSGNPAALDQAIAITGFDGRVIIGSWYGQKRADLHLGGRFHRSRIRLISSQVSTFAPHLTGRWTKSRRLQVTWQMLQHVKPARFIIHRFPVEQAAQAYALLDQHAEMAIQVLLTYDH